jgi:hypothetical protein
MNSYTRRRVSPVEHLSIRLALVPHGIKFDEAEDVSQACECRGPGRGGGWRYRQRYAMNPMLVRLQSLRGPGLFGGRAGFEVKAGVLGSRTPESKSRDKHCLDYRVMESPARRGVSRHVRGADGKVEWPV